MFKLLHTGWIPSVILFFIIVSLGIAIAYPIVNYDSLTYHMARVAHWEQNHNISHYQTHILRQLISPPFAEFVILHLQILTGGDILANSVQVFFFLCCISNISLLTKEFGGSYRQQLLGALFTCLIPMAIIESNTTQNDIVVAFFATSFVYLTIRILKAFTLKLLVLAGIAFGLALLTKGTAYLFTTFFCLWYLIILIKKRHLPFKQILKQVAVLMIIPLTALLLNIGHFYRNIFLTGSPLGNASVATGNESFEVKQLALVTVKNFLNHMPVNKGIKEILTTKTAELGIDVNDPRYNYNTLDWMAEGISLHEDYAQNIMHAVLFVLLGILFFFKKRIYNEPPGYYLLFVFTVYASVLLFCILLKWQPWSNRLEIGLFMLFSVVMAIETGRAKKIIQALCILPMLGFAVAALLASASHPLLPISKSIFKNSYTSYMEVDPLLKCRDFLDSTSYKKIGIYIGPDSRDYIYFKFLSKSRNGQSRIIKHIAVNNESDRYLDDFSPDVLISIINTTETLGLHGKVYHRIELFSDNLAIYKQ